MCAVTTSQSSDVNHCLPLRRAVVAVSVSMFAVGCVDKASQAPVAAPDVNVAAHAPIRLGILLDKSGSIRENVVPGMSLAELEDTIALVNTPAGGEVAVGVLCNVSGDKPFVRLYVPQQAATAHTGSPAGPVDPFTEMQRAQVAAAAAAQQAQTEAGSAALRRTEIDRFRTEALALIEAPASCTRTDVVAGANRLTTYLAEPVVARAGGVDPLRVAVYVTDGKDNVRRQTLRRDSELEAAYLLVGGSEDAGVLSPLNPSRFESMTAALRWVRDAVTR
jgi:hypothetical protein